MNSTVVVGYDKGDIGFVIFASILLWIMIPGCGFFYSGMARSKNSLSLLLLSFWSMAIVSIQWYLFGYSLAFSQNANYLIGDFQNIFLIGVYNNSYPGVDEIPELVFCLYQGITATLAPSLILGIVAERGRMIPAVIFIFIWTTLVYDPIACWSLNPNGWSYRLGVLDFGGGAPVHVPSGAAALAYAFILGPRQPTNENLRPHNMQSLIIGTTLIWFGSFGYNIGSAFSANLIATMSTLVANISGSAGAITWALLDYRKEKKLTAFGFCAGAVVGLVVILPGSGFVSPSSGLIFGVIAAIGSYIGLQIKDKLNLDDTLDVFVMHGISGVIGNFLTGIFTQKSYGGIAADNGGWLDGNWIQVIYQLADTGASFIWSFGISFISLYLMNKIPCLKLRVSPEIELEGVDETEVGLKCYEFIEGIKIIPIENNIDESNENSMIENGNETNISKHRQSITTRHGQPIQNHWF